MQFEEGADMNDRIGIRRLVRTLLVAVLGLAITVGVAGCAKNDEELIRAAITESMEVLKNPTEENLSVYLEDSSVDMSQLEQYGVDPYEFLSHCFAKFDYKVNDVVIDGKDATANITITNVDLGAAAETAAADITANLGDYADVLSSQDAEQGLMKVFMQKFYEQLDAATETIDTPAELKFTKDGDEWVVDEESIVTLVEGMYGGVEI